MFRYKNFLKIKTISNTFIKKYNRSANFSSVSLQKSFPQEKFFEVTDKTGLMFSLDDKPGVLIEALKVFSKNGVNMTYINSRPCKISKNSNNKKVDFFVDFEGNINDKKIQQSLNELKQMASNVNIFKTEEIPWFPKTIKDMNLMGRTLLSAGEALSSDHPGFKDSIYRQRREDIVKTSNTYYMEDGENVPTIDYTPEETDVWNLVYNKLVPLHKKYACDEFNESFDHFVKECGFRGDKIPQIKDIYNYLKEKTNTIFRPVGGLLTQREFLNGLAYRVFHSTQYIRHRSAPLYTPEPDIIHEILGHAPLFANKDFADFSQEIGMASLAATDQEIERLGTIYWFTIEFGVCMQKGERKIYGAGILSSPSEIEWAMSDKPKFHDFDIFKIANFPYSITDIQENYFLAPSFEEMKKQVIKYSENIKKPFNITYNVQENCMEIDRAIVTKKENSIPSGEKLF